MPPSSKEDDIAIIGMACRVAGANSPSELWDVLASSKDVQCKISRFNIDGFYQPGASQKGATNVQNAYMLEDDIVDKFDSTFFHTTPIEARAMDPQNRMLLEIAYEAIESAGIPLDDFVGTDTAVFTGTEGSSYHSVLGKDPDTTPKYIVTGTASCMAANRVSYFFDLSGPSMAVDTACSSSMAALHQAVRTLQHGDSKMALVSGANLFFSAESFVAMSQLGFLSPSGRCRSFDATGDGYGRGEGILGLLLKPLNQAIEDGDPIRAIVKGTRLNQDGRTQGITLPSTKAQQQNMEELYKGIGISPNDVQYLEAHGTGTAAGDPLEFAAINKVFTSGRTRKSLIVGSVKSNLGHTEAGSALAGIIKTILSLERGQIPPQMHFKAPNPKIDFSNVHVPQQPLEWPSDVGMARRAAVNTFGAGGTNGHIVLESYVSAAKQKRPTSRPFLFKVSSADVLCVSKLSDKYAGYVEVAKPDLRDLAHTLLCRRSLFRHSRFLVAASHDELLQKLRSNSDKVDVQSNQKAKRIAFFFTGQGTQWPQMGQRLIRHSLVFKTAIQECEDILEGLADSPSWSLLDELSKDKEVSRVYEGEISQPLCTALQLGLVSLLRSWDLKPDVVVGHSSGEIAAAYAAGELSLRDAMVIAYYRGTVLRSRRRSSSPSDSEGSMCAVNVSEKGAQELLEPYNGRVQLAAVNSPTSCTLAGDKGAIDDIVTRNVKAGIFCRQLRVDMAYHSHHMLPLIALYEARLKSAGVTAVSMRRRSEMFSSVTGRLLRSGECSPEYWTRNMRSTVRFATATQEMFTRHPDITTIIELGPHPALKGPVQEILRNIGREQIDFFGTCLRGEDDMRTLLSNVGGMVASGIPFALNKINAQESLHGNEWSHQSGEVLNDLPSYVWNHSMSFWSESRISHNLRFRKFPRHQLLGSRNLEDDPSHPRWRNTLSILDIEWLSQLKSESFERSSPTVFLLMALEAARQLSIEAGEPTSQRQLSDVHFEEPLPFIDPEASIELQLMAQLEVGEDRSSSVGKSIRSFCFEIHSTKAYKAESWTRHCRGIFKFAKEPSEVPTFEPLVVNHDDFLLSNSKFVGINIDQHISDLRLSRHASKGTYSGMSEDLNHYFVDPLALNSILSQPHVSLLQYGLPTAYRLSRLSKMTVPYTASSINGGSYTTKIEKTNSCGASARIHLEKGNTSIILQDLVYQATHAIEKPPMTSSLFYQTVNLPDITRMEDTEPMTTQTMLQLTTHKWPMVDIKLAIGSEVIVEKFRKALDNLQCGRRSRFRTLLIKNPMEINEDQSQEVQHISHKAKYHLLVVDSKFDIDHVSEVMHVDGLVCLPEAQSGILNCAPHHFVKVGDLADLGEKVGGWSLWRKPLSYLKLTKQHRMVVFRGGNQNPAMIETFPYAIKVDLEPHAVRDFCQASTLERYDALIVDCLDKSVIATWSGQDFIPWVQELMRRANSVLWVTQTQEANPFLGIAGSLLRSLQSEMPSLKTSWLILGRFGDSKRLFYGEKIAMAFERMYEGENELKLEYADLQPRIPRYVPDEDLCVKTGTALPGLKRQSMESRDYMITVPTPQKTVMLALPPTDYDNMPTNLIAVEVSNSVIDADGLRTFRGSTDLRSDGQSGTYFAGTILTSMNNVAHPTGSIVAGWCHGAHRSRVLVSSVQLFQVPAGMSSDCGAVRLAAVATASCVVEHVARARDGDVFRTNVPDVLHQAIATICQHYGAAVIANDQKLGADVEFIVRLSTNKGILVNGKSVDVTRYLQSERGVEAITSWWNSEFTLTRNPTLFDISNHTRAFLHAEEAPYETVLSHTQDSMTTIEHVPSPCNQQQLVASKGIYVIIGGLGGLGCYVCRWLIEHGACHISAISRSGINSSKAQELYDFVNASGKVLEVFKADACDRKAISQVLGNLRAKAQIKGIINMAMVLGDAPIATMTGDEWDRALRVKIDSSWILHEETSHDDLEFFILFSSIASVLGNRNQVNYNVGNDFLNALAKYRRTLGLPGVSVALGAMTDMGVLHDLDKANILETLSRSGLSHLESCHLDKIMMAAVLRSRAQKQMKNSFRHSKQGETDTKAHYAEIDDSLIVTGLEMFDRLPNGELKGRSDPTYWTDLPEFSHLMTYSPPSTGSNTTDDKIPLKEWVEVYKNRVDEDGRCELQRRATKAFKSFLGSLLGYSQDSLNTAMGLVMYGLDSLGAVGCQYWFFRELAVDVSVSEIFAAASIDSLITEACNKLSSENDGFRASEEHGGKRETTVFH